jgi:hypothetical protein
MVTTWCASSCAGSPEDAQTVGIRGTARAGQEVTKSRTQVWSIFEKLFNFCKDLILPKDRQREKKKSGKDKRCLRWICDWQESPRTACMCPDHY